MFSAAIFLLPHCMSFQEIPKHVLVIIIIIGFFRNYSCCGGGGCCCSCCSNPVPLKYIDFFKNFVLPFYLWSILWSDFAWSHNLFSVAKILISGLIESFTKFSVWFQESWDVGCNLRRSMPTYKPPRISCLICEISTVQHFGKSLLDCTILQIWTSKMQA